jgi:small neutral amino acid transporter SnatA (MarC family)
MASEPAKSSPKAARRLYRPGMLAAAVTLFWAASQEPDQLSLPNLIAWLLGAATIGLLVRAAFAVAEPLLKLLANLTLQAASRVRAGDGGL